MVAVEDLLEVLDNIVAAVDIAVGDIAVEGLEVEDIAVEDIAAVDIVVEGLVMGILVYLAGISLVIVEDIHELLGDSMEPY